MTTFVTVAAVRIQSWLVRTPELKLLRGASAALAAQTSENAVTSVLQEWGWTGEVEVERSAGEIDGVVVVRVAAPRTPNEVASRLQHHLSTVLPGLDWEAWCTNADSYVAAYGRYLAGDPAVTRSQRLAPLLEATLASTCQGCRAETAPEYSLGRDCATRSSASAVAQPGIPGRPPRTFDELAVLDGLADAERAIGRRTSRNHLATVVADGNRIGHLFDAIRVKGDDALNERAVAGLAAATRNALTTTYSRLQPKPTIQPVIEHYVGGDDVFVSVPARLAWKFVTLLAEQFEREIQESLVRSAGIEDVPTLGIGLVFADAAHPIADSHALASAAMKRAKKATLGRESAVVWTDLTVEAQAPAGRLVRSSDLLDDLGERTPAAARRLEVMRMEPSARAALAGLITSDWGDGSERELGVLADLIWGWAMRTDRPALPELDPKKAPQERRQAVVSTRDLLSRARWWPERRGISLTQTGGVPA